MSDNNQSGPENGNGGGNGGGANPWMKSLLIWVGILMGLALFVTMLDGRSATTAGNEIPYSTFLNRVDDGSVKDVAISRDMIVGTMANGDKFRARPLADATLIPKLREKGVTIAAKAEEGPSVWMMLLYNSLPFILMLGLAFFVIRQMQKNAG